MELSMQERDALLAGLALLQEAITKGATKGFDPRTPEANPLSDLLTNGGMHDGLSLEGCARLADTIVGEYPCPAIAKPHSASRA